jgi:hypothetical protein
MLGRSNSPAFPRIGYVPFSAALDHPADRRRFPAYARSRGISFEIARPDKAYDLVVLSEVADIATWSNYRRGKLVYDLIDSYLAVPLSDPKQLLRGLAWFAVGRHSRPFFNFPAALARMCRRADAVVCTTEEQRQMITALCDNVHIVLDLHDDLIRAVKTDYRAGNPIELVWEGLASNVYQLDILRDALRDLSRRHAIHLSVVTDLDMPRTIPWLGRVKTLKIAQRIFDHVTVHPWTESTWSEVITRCDLAVIPINLHHPLTAGKPGNKLSLLWRAAMPVLTSATPAYVRMQEAAGLGRFACKTPADWRAALEELIGDEAGRREAGTRGRDYVTRRLNSATLLEAWDRVLSSVGISVDDARVTGRA